MSPVWAAIFIVIIGLGSLGIGASYKANQQKKQKQN